MGGKATQVLKIPAPKKEAGKQESNPKKTPDFSPLEKGKENKGLRKHQREEICPKTGGGKKRPPHGKAKKWDRT